MPAIWLLVALGCSGGPTEVEPPPAVVDATPVAEVVEGRTDLDAAVRHDVVLAGTYGVRKTSMWGGDRPTLELEDGTVVALRPDEGVELADGSAVVVGGTLAVAWAGNEVQVAAEPGTDPLAGAPETTVVYALEGARPAEGPALTSGHDLDQLVRTRRVDVKGTLEPLVGGEGRYAVRLGDGTVLRVLHVAEQAAQVDGSSGGPVVIGGTLTRTDPGEQRVELASGEVEARLTVEGRDFSAD